MNNTPSGTYTLNVINPVYKLEVILLSSVYKLEVVNQTAKCTSTRHLNVGDVGPMSRKMSND